VAAQRRPEDHPVGQPLDRRAVVGQRPRRGRRRLEVLPHQPEELRRRQVERHVRLPVGVDDDQVVAPVGPLEERPAVGRDRAQPRVVAEPEVAAAGLSHGRVDLDARMEAAVCARDRAARVADHQHRARLAAKQRGDDVEEIPVAAGQHRVGPPDRVDGHALVQLEHAGSVRTAQHLHELVPRLVLVQEPGLRLDRAGRQREQRDERERDDEPASWQQRRRRQREQGRRADEGALRARERDRDERREERPRDRAGRRERVQPPGDRAGARDVDDGEPDGER
jgi:hypothetical protein